MNTPLSVLIFRMVIILMMVATSASAANYYLVIGSFAEEANARRFTAKVSTQFRRADYTFNAQRKVWYVHVMKTTRKDEAARNQAYLREQRGFKDAWIFTEATDAITPDSFAVGEGAPRGPRFETGESLLKGSGPVMASAAKGSSFLSYAGNASDDRSGEADGSEAAPLSAELSWTDKWGVRYIPAIKDANGVHAANAVGADRIFTFVVEDSKGEEIGAEVMLVDFEKGRRITSFPTGEYAAIQGTRREQMVTLVCEVLGYAQETRMYNIDHLARGRDIRKNKDGIWEVRFKLRNMEVNDIAYLNRTSFFTNTAVLQPSAKEEVDELLRWMKVNPEKRIIIHSHCNPGGKREIHLPGTDYFSLDGAHVKNGSDKKLTKSRAIVLKNYLLAHGIDRRRVGIVGWGSLEPLAKPGSPDASLNERIEFELVEE